MPRRRGSRRSAIARSGRPSWILRRACAASFSRGIRRGSSCWSRSRGKESGVLAPWLAASITLYHLASEANDLAGAIAHLRKSCAKVVVEPILVVAFDGRDIAFLLLANRLLIELIERDSV